MTVAVLSAYRAGRKAFRVGTTISACAYKELVRVKAWEDGWRHEQRVKEQREWGKRFGK